MGEDEEHLIRRLEPLGYIVATEVMKMLQGIRKGENHVSSGYLQQRTRCSMRLLMLYVALATLLAEPLYPQKSSAVETYLHVTQRR